MSISAMNAVWKLTSLPGMDKSVLLALADYANSDGLCWPSVETLARKSAWSERAVQDAIRRLIEKKFLVVEMGIKRGRQTVNRYTVLPGREEIVRGAGDSPLPPSRGAAGSTRGAAGSPLRGAAGSPPLIFEPSESESPQEPRSIKSIQRDRPLPSSMVLREDYPKELLEEFREFYYGKYPRKINPARAEKEWFRARKLTTFPAIMAGLENALASAEWAEIAKDGRSIIPHPSSWLSARGWENCYTKKAEGGKMGQGLQEFLANKEGK